LKSHKDLEVWKKAIALAKAVYNLTKDLPREEIYSLSDQMKRSAISIASNIAEGAARQTNKEFLQFLYIALGSASELDTQIEICREISFKNVKRESLETLQSELQTISKMIYGLITRIKHNHESSKSQITSHKSQITVPEAALKILRNTVMKYENPTEPVGSEDWESLK
jgi:four helix bundle protein